MTDAALLARLAAARDAKTRAWMRTGSGKAEDMRWYDQAWREWAALEAEAERRGLGEQREQVA